MPLTEGEREFNEEWKASQASESNGSQRVYDVIVVGLGGMGSAITAHLAAQGASVLGLERNESGGPHDEGSSHGSSRVFRTAYFEHPSYVPLLQRSKVLFDDLEIERKESFEARSSEMREKMREHRSDNVVDKTTDYTEEPLCRWIGGLMIGRKNSIVIQGTLASCKEHGLGVEKLSANEIKVGLTPTLTLTFSRSTPRTPPLSPPQVSSRTNFRQPTSTYE